MVNNPKTTTSDNHTMPLLTPLLTPPSAQDAAAVHNREQDNRLI
jgi:hypothetical protein